MKKNPHLHILKSSRTDTGGTCWENWNRYLPFFSSSDMWVPYHKTYQAVWAAVKYACKEGWYSHDRHHFVMDLRSGEIVWDDFDEND